MTGGRQGGYEGSTSPAERRGQFDQNRRFQDVMRWKGDWEPGRYDEGDVILDDGYTMVCTNPNGCTQRPSPQPVGDPFNVYQGVDPTTSLLAKQIIFGNKYTWGDTAGYVTGLRVYTVVGNEYALYVVEGGVVTEVANFTAGETGWQTIEIADRILGPGSVFDVLAIVQEPDPTPTTYVGDWNYTTPPNQGVPATGTIIHANSATGVLQIHKTPAAGQPPGLVTVGDIIEIHGTRYAIQSVTDQGTYIDFGVAPAVQVAPDGITTVTFETVTATPVTVLADVDYWLTPLPSGTVIQGTYKIDDQPEVVDDTAYGTDVIVQEATFSDQWELVSAPGGGGGGGTGYVLKTGDTMTGPLIIDDNVSDVPVLHIKSVGLDTTLVDGTGFLVLESLTSGRQLAFDGNEVQCREAGVAQEFQIQSGGGFTRIGDGMAIYTLPGGGGAFENEVLGLHSNSGRPYLRFFGDDGNGKMYVGYPDPADDTVYVRAQEGPLHLETIGSDNVTIVANGLTYFNALPNQSPKQTRIPQVVNDTTTATSNGIRSHATSGRLYMITSSGAVKSNIHDPTEEEEAEWEGLRPRVFTSDLDADSDDPRPGFILEEIPLRFRPPEGDGTPARSPDYGSILAMSVQKMRTMRKKMGEQQDEIDTMKSQMQQMNQRLLALEAQ